MTQLHKLLCLLLLLVLSAARVFGSATDWSVEIGVLAADPGVAESGPPNQILGTRAGASDGPVLFEDKKALVGLAPPYVSLVIRHPGDDAWASFARPSGDAHHDFRAPLEPEQEKTWLLRVTADNGAAAPSPPRSLILLWRLVDVPAHIALRLTTPSGAALDMKSTTQLPLIQTAATQFYELTVTATNTQSQMRFTAPPTVEATPVSAILRWSTDKPAVSRLDYGETERYGLVVQGPPTPTRTHSFGLGSLKPWTTYHYRVRAVSPDPLVLPLESADLTFTTPPLPIEVSSLQVSEVTARSATLSWTTDVPSTSRVEYWRDESLQEHQEDTELVTEHRLVLVGLQPDTLYHYRAVSQVPGSATGQSEVGTFRTQVPVTITNGPLVSLGGDNATISWTTDRPSTTRIDYGETEALGTTLLNPTRSTDHRLQILGLKAKTLYYFRVTSEAPGLAPAVSDLLSFTTQGEPVTITSGPGVGLVTRTSAVITYMTDVPATTAIQFGKKGQPLDQATVLPGTRTTHTVELRGLEPATTYEYRVSSEAPGRATTISTTREFATLADPAVISQVAVRPGITDAWVTYRTSIPVSSRVEYGAQGVHDQFVLRPEASTEHSVQLTGLSPGTRYSFRVVAEAPGHEKAVASGPDFSTKPPVVNLTGQPVAEGVTSTSALIVWRTDEPADSAVEYGESVDQTLRLHRPGLRTAHRVLLQGLQPGRTYHYWVTSEREGLFKAQSAVLSFSTPANASLAPLAAFSVPDVANDNSGRILDQLSPFFGGTTGLERAIAVDEENSILYVARGSISRADGRVDGVPGVAAVRYAAPLERSANPAPGAAAATSRYTDTGLLTADASSGGADASLGDVMGLARDEVTGRLFVLAGSPTAPRVYSAQGGTLGGAPEGGDTSAANPALQLAFAWTDDAAPDGGPVPGARAHDIAVHTREGVTRVYLAMGTYADVWTNEGGAWRRVWSSAPFPPIGSDGGPVPEAGPVDAVAVDPQGNSYWSARGPSPRIWQFPSSALGKGLGFRDVALGGSSEGGSFAARPVLLRSDGTHLGAEALEQVSDLAVGASQGSIYLWLAAVGSATPRRPTVARVLLPEDPSLPGDALPATVVDAFGPGALDPRGPLLETLTLKRPLDPDGTQYTQPAGESTDRLHLAVAPTQATLWVNGFVRDAEAGQAVPTAAAVAVAYAPELRRPFFTQAPTVQDAALTSVTVAFRTDVPTRATVHFGLEGSLDQVLRGEGLATEHALRLEGLTPGKRYAARVTVEAEGLAPAVYGGLEFDSPGFLPGDGNQNGRLDIGDAVLCVQLALRQRPATSTDLLLLDVAPLGAPDGLITIQDVQALLRAVLGLETLSPGG